MSSIQERLAARAAAAVDRTGSQNGLRLLHAGGFGKNMAEEHAVYEKTKEAKAEFALKKATFKGEFLGKKGIAVQF